MKGLQDYDIFLRFLEKTTPERVYHIPKILYHWRMIEGSTGLPQLIVKDMLLKKEEWQ